MSKKVFVITGASSGIGLATAKRAAEAGYCLVLAARSIDRLKSTVDGLGPSDGHLRVPCDVTSWQDQENLVKTAIDQLGQVDVVFANAGIGRASGGFTSGDPDLWKQIILTNVYGAALTVRASMAALVKSKGHLLLTGSVAGRRVNPGSIYACSKWAITAMAESARQELVGTGVRVSLIEPGGVNTPFHAESIAGALEADDVARAVMFAVEQPPSVNVNEILIRPTAQAT